MQDYATGMIESPGFIADQKGMTPNGEERGRGYITSKYGDDQHEQLVTYMSWMQSHFEPFMHVREAGPGFPLS